MRKLLFILLAMIHVICPCGEDKPDFSSEVKKTIANNKDFFDEQSKLALSDHLFEANAALVKRADIEKSPYFDFVVANKLYGMDPEAAFRLHERVVKALPSQPEVNLEWAMICHRRGEYLKAVAAYELFLKANPDQPPFWALLADCYLHTNKVDEAIAAWEKAKHGSHHTEIDFAICSIYGGLDPLRKRADILKNFDAGDSSVLEALVLQDLNMESDWWNTHVYKEGLDRDIARAQKALGAESRRFKELAGLAALKLQEEVTQKESSDQLKRLHVLIGDGDLPVNSVVASHFIALAMRQKLIDTKSLSLHFCKELEERATSKAGDVEALNIVCVFYSAAEDWKRVKELDQMGWERYKDVRFATSFLAELLRDHVLAVDTPEFKTALTQFPENTILWKYRLALLGKDHLTVEDVAGAIKAEYHDLSNREGVIKDSYTLNGYFALLKKLRNP